MLAVRGFTLTHDHRTMLRNLNVVFAPGEVSALFGLNGAGQFHPAEGLFGEHVAASRNLEIAGETFRRSRRRAWQSRIGYVPQDSAPGTGLTALEVVLLGTMERLSLWVPLPLLEAAVALLECLGILDLAHRRIDQLSGGGKQLVYFAQVLMRRPSVLLLDEPVSVLDLRHQILLLRKLRSLTRARGLVSILVLHDLNLAALFADRVVMLHEGTALGRRRAARTVLRRHAALGIRPRR